MAFKRKFMRRYRRVFGHRGPYARVYGHRSVGQAIGVTARQTNKALGYAVDAGGKVAKLAAEVKQIRARMNVEKKHIEKVLTGGGDEAYPVGQVSQNDEGYTMIDLTPDITQGIGHDQRVGNSLKMTGISFKYQMNGQTNCHTPRRVRFTLLKVSSPDVASITYDEIANMMYDVNPLTGVRDTNAPLNYATLKQNGIKIIRTHTCRLGKANDMQAGTSGASAELENAHKTGQFSVKLQDLIRFASSSATKPEGHRYWLLAQCDVGNSSNTSSTKGDIPITINDTGVLFRMHAKYWWVDN